LPFCSWIGVVSPRRHSLTFKVLEHVPKVDQLFWNMV
jgi:hypothetical protein